MLLGLIPALIVAAVFTVGIVTLGLNLERLVTWATPFADAWHEPWPILVRFLLALAALGATVLVIVLTFTALTLAVGDPFYERIWRAVEDRDGGLPPGTPRSWSAGLGDALRTVIRATLVGIPLLLGGFVPILGQTVMPVATAGFAGWMLAVELTGRALDWRGLDLRARRRLLAEHRAQALGFGLATYLVCLIPLGAVLVMPAAVAGATLLARSLTAPLPAAPDSPARS